MAARAARSAVTWAAKGVDLREPLKPAEPALAHEITLPSLSVRVTRVLLNDVLMYALPTAMLLRTLRRRPRGPVAVRLGFGIFLDSVPSYPLQARPPARPAPSS